MLLTITTTHRPATDLGFLLAKHPERFQTFELAYGKAHVFYPVADAEQCTAALLLDIDPVGLVRGRRRGDAGTLEQYVNDRPYVASSFLSVAIAQVFGTALAGRCRERPELAERPIPLGVALPAVPCRGGEAFLRKLFEPLGYRVTANRLPLEPAFPSWGDGPYYRVGLEHQLRLKELLGHLYVLVPVLDDEKHYWVGADELEKLLTKGEGWLATHPARETIVRRYLKYQGALAREALRRLADEDQPDPDAADEAKQRAEVSLEERVGLNQERIGAVLSVLRDANARRVVDLGCGEGRLVRELLRDRTFERIVGVDVSSRALALAARRLRLDELAPAMRARVELCQGALTYRDRRLEGFDAACAVEVIEHLDPSRLGAFERCVFEFARPRTVIVTTPNREYNVRFELAAGRLRHGDHRFEWTRAEFDTWACGVAGRRAYRVRLLPVGAVDPDVGPPTQMAVFSR